MTPRIRKAVFPVAGLGTRFLPATKAMPKEMLPVVDRPLIQHVVDEAREAGIEHFIFVTGRNKGVIEDHFDRQFELEMTLLERKQKRADLELLSQDLPEPGTDELHPPAGAARPRPRGLVRARTGRPRAVRAASARRAGAARARLPRADDRCRAASSASSANIIAVEEVPMERIDQYGVVGVGERKGKVFSITADGGEAAARAGAIEPHHHRPLHPAAGDLRPAGKQERGAGGEIQLTDAMIALARDAAFYGLKFEGRSFDCGSKIGFLAANVSYALAREDIAPGFRAEIKRIIGENGA